MRICHIIEASGGGSARIVAELARCMSDGGDEVTVIYSSGRADRQFIVALERVPRVRAVPMVMQRKVGLEDIFTSIDLYRTIRRLGSFDVIHCHSSKAGALGRLAGVFLPRAALVYSPHAFYSMAPGKSKAYAWIEYGLSWVTDAIVTVSPAEREHAIRHIGIAPKKLHMVVNGVQPDWPVGRAAARAALGMDEQCFVLGFVGRLAPQKNPLLALETFALVLRGNPDARLVMLGDGEMEGEVRSALVNMNLQGSVTLLSGKEARDIMPAFDCLLCTSDYEGFAVVFLEALAAGVAIVTTRVGGAEEAVLEGKTGYIVDSASAQALAERVAYLKHQPERGRQEFARHCLEHAQHFTVGKMAEATRAIYLSAAAGRTRASS